MPADNMPDEEELAEMAAPVVFLFQRRDLAVMRTAADEVRAADELKEAIDDTLAATEEVTRDFLLRPWKFEMDYLDEVFTDEFLELCVEMRVDLISWLNQPEILMRLEHPDAILLRYADIAAAMEGDGGLKGSSVAFSEKVTEMENALNATFETLKRNGAI